MSDKPSEKKDIPFQTPNPTELKQAAKDDPLQTECLGSQEANVADVPSTEQNADQPEPLITDDNPDSQIIHANLSGH